jgi:hypothetical protein
MANNLYDYLNQFNLGQVVQGIPGVLQGTADFLNRNQIGTRGIKQTPSYYGPAYASAEALGIKPGGLRNYGTGYKEKELAAGAAAERFRPGAGFPGQQAAADRAYESEKARVSQLTAQDPELQRYEKARAGAKTQEEMNAARDIGMQIWAQRNPELATKVKPGQSGYDVIQGSMAGQAAAQGFGYQMPQQITMTPPPGVNVPQGLPAVGSIGPAETYGDQGLVVDPEMAKKFQELLNQANK